MDAAAAAAGRHRRHRLDARRDRARADDDARRSGSSTPASCASKNTLNTFMMCIAAIARRDGDVGAGRLLARVRRQRRRSSAASTTRSCTTSTFAPRDGTHDPAPALLGLPGDLLHHHRRAGLRRGGRADALRAVPGLRRAVVGARLRGARALGLRRRLAAARTARSTSPAACRSRWAPASRRWRRRSWSARARTTAARRCCRTTRSTCCSAPACCGSAGSASTAAAASRPATPSVLAFTNTLLTPGLHAGRLVRARPDPRPAR